MEKKYLNQQLFMLCVNILVNNLISDKETNKKDMEKEMKNKYLIRCYRCKELYQHNADWCPHCGFPNG